MKIDVSGEPCPEVFAAVVSGVRAFNADVLGQEASVPLSVIARDDCGRLVGGVAGRTIYHQFLIEVVWIAPDMRRQGVGRELMLTAEAEAKARGCVAAQVDTLVFQGPKFYAALGFDIIGSVTGIPEIPDRYFLLKRYHP